MKASDSNDVTCPICSAGTREFCRKIHAGETWLIYQCVGCGHGFVTNRPSLDELRTHYERLESNEPRVLPSREDLERRADCRSFARRIAQLTKERGRTLDIGAGGGGFSYHLAAHGFGPLLLNDFDAFAGDVTSVIPNSEFLAGAFEEIDDPGPFSAIVMSQVLEHTLDPLDWLRRSRAMLSPGGVLAIAVPNFAGVYHLLGHRDPFLIPPFHLNFFTPRSIRRALEQCGLEIVKLETRSILAIRSGRENQRVSMRRLLVARLWNLFGWMLAPTRFGIILRVYARPRSSA